MAGVTAPLPPARDKARAVEAMFDRISDRYDLVNRVMTLGLDAGWRRRSVAELRLAPGSAVLDLACGTGDLCRELRRQRLRPVGVDCAARMLDRARARTPAPLVRADMLRLPFADGCADGVACGFALRNVTDLGAALAEMARVLRPGGRVALLEMSEPDQPLLRAGHRVYLTRAVPFVGGLLSDAGAYRYLPASVAYLPPPGRLVAAVAAAGFEDARRLALGAGAVQLICGTRR